MLSLSKILKKLINKKNVIITNISDTYIKAKSNTEITNSTTEKNGEIYTAIYNGMKNNLPPKYGCSPKEKEISVQIPQSGLYLSIPDDTYIYIAGHYTVLQKQNIALQPNKDSYIYISEDINDTCKSKIEVYDRILGGNDKEIHFSRIFAIHAKTDSNKVVLTEKHETANYKSTI